MLHNRRYLLAAAGVVLWTLSAVAVSAQQPAPPPAEVRAALANADRLLGSGPAGDQWRRYLGLDELEREVAQGSARPDTVEHVLDRLNSRATGLERPEFVSLRQALSNYLNSQAQASSGDLGEAIRQAEFHPPTAQELEQPRADLRRAIAQLSRTIDGWGNVGPGWRRYLMLNDLQRQLQPGGTPDANLLGQVLARLSDDKNGLELEPMRAVRDRLRNYAGLLEASQSPELEKQYRERLGVLAQALEQYRANPQEESAAEINAQLEWLDRMHQAPGLRRAIRRAFAAPNIYATASQRFVDDASRQYVNDVMPVNDVILGTDIHGTGHTVARVDMQLVPDGARARLETVLSGVVYSNTVGENGPATICATGTTTILGRKLILADGNGLQTYPACGSGHTCTQITGVRAGPRPGGLIDRIAWRRVEESKPDAEQVASAHAGARVRARLDQEVGARVAQVNQRLARRLRNPLVRRDLMPEDLRLSTDPNAVRLVATEAEAWQVSASGPPPALNEQAFDVAARIHETALNNVLQKVLMDLTLRDEAVRGRIIELFGELPQQVRDREDQEPWSITFDKFRPVSVSLSNPGAVTITVRGRRYTTGENDKNKYGAMNVTATYQIEQTPNGPVLARQGALDVSPPDKGPQPPRTIALKTILRRKFATLFPERIEPNAALASGKTKPKVRLELGHLQIERGWVAAGFRERPPGAQPALRTAGREATPPH